MTEMTEPIQAAAVAEAVTSTALPPAAEDAKKREKKEIAKFTRKRSKKKKWIILAVVVLAVVAGWKILALKSTVLPLDTIPLARQRLSNTVSLTGLIESAESGKVFSESAATVKTLHVKVGDHVNEGDVLALFDTEDLEISIAAQRAAMNVAAKTNEIRLSNAEKNYQNTTADLANDMDAKLTGAEQALESAQRALNDARVDLNNHKDDMNTADEVLNALEKQLNRARDASDVAEKEYNKALQVANNNASDPAVIAAKADFDTKEIAYEKVLKEWNVANNEYGGDLGSYSKAYRRAREAYERALDDRNIAQQESERRLESLQSDIELSELSGDMTTDRLKLKQLEKQLADSTLTAPVSGTVTAVNLKEGEPGAVGRVAFVVEDIGRLIVKSKLKEYDVASVKPGMPVTIKSDATGEKAFDGKVSRISPTAVKAADGSTDTAGGVEFATDVDVVSQNTGLLVGMNTRMNVILAEKENVFAVPFDAVITDAQGQKIIYVAKPDAQGKMHAKAVPVTTGLETNFDIEISGDALVEGEPVILNPIGIVPDSIVNIMPKAPVTAGGAAGGAASGAPVSVTVG